MSVFKRLGDIFSANVNDLVDKFENPEKMLRQAIRQMETEIGEATVAAAKALANEKLLSRRLDEQEPEVAVWQQRAERAVEAGDDKLARKALERKQECGTLAASLRDELLAAQDASQTLRRQMDGMKDQYEEAKRKLASLIARKRTAEACCDRPSPGRAACSLRTAAFDKFERLKDKVEMAEAEAEAMVELQRVSFDRFVHSDPSPQDVAVEAELAAMKAGLHK